MEAKEISFASIIVDFNNYGANEESVSAVSGRHWRNT